MQKRVIMHKVAATAAVESELFAAGTTFCVDGDLGSDVITFELIGINDEDLTDFYDNDETLVKLSSTRTAFMLQNHAHLKVSRPSTTNAIGIYVIE